LYKYITNKQLDMTSEYCNWASIYLDYGVFLCEQDHKDEGAPYLYKVFNQECGDCDSWINDESLGIGLLPDWCQNYLQQFIEYEIPIPVPDSVKQDLIEPYAKVYAEDMRKEYSFVQTDIDIPKQR
jgi:hypothetical protein